MQHRREFDIAFVGLAPGEHYFQYIVRDEFFVPFGKQDFEKCNANVKLTLEKNTNFMQLKFDVDGSVESSCDRCGNTLTIQLWDEFKMIVKLVDNPEEMNNSEEDPDIYYINKTESILSIANWVYEFVLLSIPMQKECAKNANGESNCNTEVLAMIQKMELDSANAENPIWEGLAKFKKLD